MDIGQYIKKKREEKDLSINQLALYSDVSSAHISRIERGLREPSPEILKKIADALNTSYEKMMTVAGYLESDKKDDKEWWEKDEEPSEIELEKFIREKSNIKLMGDPLDDDAKDDVMMFLRAAHQLIKEKRKANDGK